MVISMKAKKEEIRGKLSLKIILWFVILGVLITTANCIVGYIRYTAIIEKMYNDKAYSIANSAMAYIDGDTIESYFRELYEAEGDEEAIKAASERITGEDYYKNTLKLLSALRDNMGANYVYIADQTDGKGNVISTFTYLMDAENPNDEYPPFVPGNTGPMNEKFLADSEYIYSTGVRSDNYFYSHSAFGYNTSAIMPIKNSQGNVVGIMGVEIAMTNLQNTRFQYMFFVVLLSVLIAALVIVGVLIAIRKMLLEPINLIVGETRAFVSNEAKVSDKLGKINTGDEIQTLAQGILKMEADIHKYIENITSITAEKERIGAELNIATKIQSDMLPSIFPAFPDRSEFDIYATMRPAKEVGGDFYDFFLLDKDHLLFLIADVSGKGVPAALFMMTTKTLIKNIAKSASTPAQILTAVNEQLVEQNVQDFFVTVFLCVLEISTGKMTCVNAAHNPPVIRRANGQCDFFQTKPNLALGIFDNTQYAEHIVTLSPGDSILLYTDGVTEAMNVAQKFYGAQRLLDFLQHYKGTPKNLIADVKLDVDVFAAGEPQADDMTMLALRYNG